MFADRLKKVMGDMSAREFALKLGKSPSTVHEYLKGRMVPLEFAVHVCECFGCNLEWLATGKEYVAEPVHPYGPAPLRPDETDLLRRYRKLDHQHQANVMEMITAYECLSEGKRGEPAVCGSEVQNLRRRSTD